MNTAEEDAKWEATVKFIAATAPALQRLIHDGRVKEAVELLKALLAVKL